MKPLIVLLAAFFIAVCIVKIFFKKNDLAFSARIAMSCMLLFTSIGHFIYTDGMAMMIPDIIPYREQLVYVTGIIEIAAGIGLLIPNVRVISAKLLIVFFILVLPANINAAINHVDYQKGTYEGSGPIYLWFRIPLQILFIVWTYRSSIKVNSPIN